MYILPVFNVNQVSNISKVLGTLCTLLHKGLFPFYVVPSSDKTQKYAGTLWPKKHSMGK